VSSGIERPYEHIVRAAWSRHHELATARGALILRVVRSGARRGSVPGRSLDQAVEAAHQLAGSLAMYGLPACAELARHLQDALDRVPRDAAEWRALRPDATRLRDALAAATQS